MYVGAVYRKKSLLAHLFGGKICRCSFVLNCTTLDYVKKLSARGDMVLKRSTDPGPNRILGGVQLPIPPDPINDLGLLPDCQISGKRFAYRSVQI